MADWKTPYQEYMFFIEKAKKYEPDIIPTWVKPLPDCEISYFSECRASGDLCAADAPSHNWCEEFGPGFDIHNHRCDRRDLNRVHEEIFRQVASAFAAPTAPPLCAKPLPPPPKEEPPARGIFGRKKKKAVIPTRPPQAPQPTRTLLPRSLVKGGDDLPPQFEPRGDVSWPTRPVITRIRVCTPQEVRKLFQPPAVVKTPTPEPRTMKQSIRRVLALSMKAAIAGFIVWLTIDQGIWGDSDETARLLSEIQYGNEDEPPPDTKMWVHRLKERWNRIVVNTIWVFLNTTNCAKRLWKYIQNQDEDDLDTPLPDTHDVVP